MVTMESLATDPYELKLYQMFQSCDSQQNGYLDEAAVGHLCGMLELQDKGSILIANLASGANTNCTSGGSQMRVTFENFKEALLNFLGMELDNMHEGSTSLSFNNSGLSNVLSEEENDQPRSPSTRTRSPQPDEERILILNEENNDNKKLNAPKEEVLNKEDHSDREVAPKLVKSGKKYGRRSKPTNLKPTTVLPVPLYNSDEDASSDDISKEASSHRFCPFGGHSHENGSKRCCHNNQSQQKRQVGENNQNSSQNVQRSASHADILKKKPHTNGVLTANGSRLKRCASLPPQRNRNREPLNEVKADCLEIQSCHEEGELEVDILDRLLRSSDPNSPYVMETLLVDDILDIWQQAQIVNGRSILLALGFDDRQINVSQLHKALEEEIRGINEPHQLTLLKASLALQTTELNTLRQISRQCYEENRKLRADNKDANRRIAIFTAEIDERHASLEDATRKEINLLEQKHAAVIRDLTNKMTTDRENWANLNNRLENRIKFLEQEDVKSKAELELLRTENAALDQERRNHLKEISELMTKNKSLSRELSRMHIEYSSVSGAHNNSKSDIQHGTINKSNINEDEFEVLQLIKNVATYKKENSDLRDKNDELLTENEALNYELSKLKAKEKEFAAEHKSEQSNQTILSENSSLRKRICELEDLLEKQPQSTPIEDNKESGDLKTKEERCKELETSLEQMQRAYEDCEDYWQLKLSEERSLFEKERQFFEDEQRDNDNKFTELMEKVREYEEQFKKDGRLSPIEEKDMLEQQYLQLENEAEELRKNTTIILENKTKEIEELQEEIESLRKRLLQANTMIMATPNSSNNSKESDRMVAGEKRSKDTSPISQLWERSAIDSDSSKGVRRSILADNQPTLVSMHVEIDGSLSRFDIDSTKVDTNQLEENCKEANSQNDVLATTAEQTQSQSVKSELGDVADCESSSVDSGRSFETHSIQSLQVEVTPHFQHGQQEYDDGVQKYDLPNSCLSLGSSNIPSGLKDDVTRLKLFELSLREQLKNLLRQRDNLVLELQQLHDAKPVLSKAYARTAHPSLIQRVNQLELKNRHLQNVVKQQQQYNESIMQQSWRQHQVELNELHGRLEAQGALIAEQVQRLQNADLFVKDLYVENSHLTAEAQRLEQQLLRASLMQKQQQQHYQQPRQNCSGLPGMP